MERFDSLPDDIRRLLAKDFGLWPADIKLVARADLSLAGQFADVWVVVTGQSLLVIGNEPGREVVSYPLKEIERLKAENLVAGGMLTAAIDQQARILCRYSNSHNGKFARLARLTKKIKEGKELTEEDFAENKEPAFCPKCGLMYPDPHRRVCPKCLDKKSVFLRVLSFMPRYKVQIAIILACMFVSAGLNLATPYIGGNVFFDEVLARGGRYYGRVVEVVLVMAGFKLMALLVSIVYGRVNSAMSAQVVYDLKSQVFTAMQRLSMSFFSRRQTGGLMTRVNNDAMELQHFFHDGLPYFIVNLVTIAGIVTTMLLVNWQLALLVLLPVPVIVYGVRQVFPRLWALFSRRFRTRRALNALVNDALTGMRVVKAFGKEKEEIDRFTPRNEGVCSVNLQLGRLTSTAFPLLRFTMSSGGLIVWGYGGWQVVNGNMTFGTLMTFTGYITMLYGPLQFMTQVVEWWSSCMNSAERIFAVLDTVPDVTESPHPVRLPAIRGGVKLENVTFGYEPHKPVLHDINLEVKAGEMIGLVGHSGAGKSTITNLITRLYDVDEGTVYIDGIDVRDIAMDDLRRQIGMVLQETFLFTGTIAENIAYARPDANQEDIIRVAKAANAHDFIMKLSDGYETIIGKHGHDLSGGEKQRLAIARAILQDPRILILDEATSSVDTETEQLIQEALERLICGRTTIAIAHRLSTLRNANRLVVIEKGRIVETGTHAKLVKNKGPYYKLLQKQREALKIRGVSE